MRNKYIIVLICFLFTIGFTAYSQNEGAVIMNLDECIRYGLENSELVNISKLEIEKQKAYVGEITAEGLPQIDATADLSKNLKLQTTFIPAIFFDPNAEEGEVAPVTFGTPYSGLAGINASQMIFNGSYFVGLNAARTLKELTTKEHIQTKRDVVEAIQKAYYYVLVSEVSYRTVQLNYDRLDSLLRETKIMHENGFTEKIEVSRTQVQFNNIKTNLENSRRELEYSKDVLKFHIGMPLETNLQIADKFSGFNINFSNYVIEDADGRHRIEEEILEIQKQLATLDLKNNHVQYLPTLDLYFGLGANAGTLTSKELFSFNDDNWFGYRMVGISATLPIFDGLRKAKKIQQNRINIAQIELQQKNLERSIDNEIKDTKILLQNSLEELKNQQENVQLAEEVYNIARIKYQEGVGSSIEVMDADNEFKRAQTNYYNALLSTLINKVNYEKALGVLMDEYN